MNSQLFLGSVTHQRLYPKTHAFKYQLYMHYLDLAEIDTLFDKYWFWSSNGYNIAAFKREKYLGDNNEGLLTSVKKLFRQKTQTEPDQVFLLTNLAYFGYCFNPISIYFGKTDGRLTHMIAEVTNTPWKEQHPYVLSPMKIAQDTYEMQFKKSLHVSPFMTMDYYYHACCKLTDEKIIFNIENWQDDACHFKANLSLQSLPINSINLAKCLLQFPFITGKVITAIHWQALKLWLKKVPVINHPS